MITVGAFEAKTKFSELLDRVERGEEVIVTRHGKQVARMTRPAQQKSSDDLLAEFKRVRARLKSEGASWTVEEIIKAKNEGRR
jgi:prevent-host-death family protein